MLFCCLRKTKTQACLLKLVSTQCYLLLKYRSSNKHLNCVNLAWSMESGVWNPIPSLGFTSKNDINRS